MNGLGILLLPRPHLLVALSCFAIFYFTGLALAQEPARGAFAQVLATVRRYPTHPLQREWLPRWGVVGYVTLLVSLGVFQPWERALWRTGQFGEPPDNRYVLACFLGSEQATTSTEALLMFGVFEVPARGFKIFAVFGADRDAYVRETTEVWFGGSKWSMIPEEGERWPLPNTLADDADAGTNFLRENDSLLLQPDRHIFAHFRSTKDLVPVACFFSRADDPVGTRCGEQVAFAVIVSAAGLDGCLRGRDAIDLEEFRRHRRARAVIDADGDVTVAMGSD